MSNILLPSVVRIGTAIQYLNLGLMPYVQALKIILDYSKDGLPLNFNSTVWALDSDIAIGNIYDREEQEFNGEIHNVVVDHKFVTEVPYAYDQEKIIDQAFISGKADDLKIYVSSFRIESKSYNIVNSAGSKYCDISVPISAVIIHKADLLAFEVSITNTDKSKQNNNRTQFTGKDKALALLALDMAIKSPKYCTKQKVNGSAIKEHIIDLAGKHLGDIDSSQGLKSIDDTIKKALNHYDINKIPD